jgi:hypothetical protein
MRTAAIALTSALTAGSVVDGAPQQGAAGTQVIVRALTNSGEPLTDLKKDEISVRTDGKSREIKELTMVRTPAADARQLLILLDEEGLAPGHEEPVRTALGNLIARLTPGDRVGLLSLRIGGVNVSPSTDQAAIKEALVKIVGGGSPRETSADLACRTKRALDTLVNAFRGSPAGRTIVLVSSGLAPMTTQRMATMQDQSSDLCMIRTVDLDNLAAAAAGSAANLYVLYYGDGLANTSLLSAAQQGLENVAGTTNGEYIRITGASDTAATRIPRETSAYYLVTLEGSSSGQIRRVEGRVARDGVRTLMKPVSGGRTAAASGKRLSPREMLATSASFSGVTLRAVGVVSRQGTADLKLMTVFEPDDPTLKLTAAAVGLLDEKGTTVKSQWTARSEELQRYPVLAALPLAPGKHKVRVAASTSSSEGTVDFEIDAALQDAPPVKFGGMMLGLTGDKGFVPKLQFGSADKMAVGVAEVYGVAKGTSLTVQFEMAEAAAAQPLGSASGNVQNGPGDDTRTVIGGFEIGTLQPGDYVMRAIVSIDGKVAGTISRTLRKVQ